MSGRATATSLEMCTAGGRRRGTERPQFVGATNHLLGGVQHRSRQSLATPILSHRNTFDIATTQGATAVDKAPLHHGAVRDDRAAMPDQGVHTAQGVSPIVIGEVAGKGGGDHLANALTRLTVQIGGMDQPSRVNLGMHYFCLPVPARQRRGRAQCSHTC